MTTSRSEPWKCQACDWTNLGYVPECDGCGERKDTATLSRYGLLEELAREKAGRQIDLDGLRALPPTMPVGEALELLDRLKDAGKRAGEAVLSKAADSQPQDGDAP